MTGENGQIIGNDQEFFAESSLICCARGRQVDADHFQQYQNRPETAPETVECLHIVDHLVTTLVEKRTTMILQLTP